MLKMPAPLSLRLPKPVNVSAPPPAPAPVIFPVFVPVRFHVLAPLLESVLFAALAPVEILTAPRPVRSAVSRLSNPDTLPWPTFRFNPPVADVNVALFNVMSVPAFNVSVLALLQVIATPLLAVIVAVALRDTDVVPNKLEMN